MASPRPSGHPAAYRGDPTEIWGMARFLGGHVPLALPLALLFTPLPREELEHPGGVGFHPAKKVGFTLRSLPCGAVPPVFNSDSRRSTGGLASSPCPRTPTRWLHLGRRLGFRRRGGSGGGAFLVGGLLHPGDHKAGASRTRDLELAFTNVLFLAPLAARGVHPKVGSIRSRDPIIHIGVADSRMQTVMETALSELVLSQTVEDNVLAVLAGDPPLTSVT